MVRIFHTGVGIVLLMIYIYVVSHEETLLPGLAAVSQGISGIQHIPRLPRGLLVIYGLPLAAIACFLFPRRLMWWLSPRPPPEFDYVLKESFWYLVGYLLAALSGAVLMLFR